MRTGVERMALVGYWYRTVAIDVHLSFIFVVLFIVFCPLPKAKSICDVSMNRQNLAIREILYLEFQQNELFRMDVAQPAF
jgi:hypothetical protein